ncbi:hypothetical protein [Flavobacterium sp. N1736]|uniref:hypothetical protein n=1 Tax=Flavobacterium sp. N1736 TaxID=2986823 RepID=UPI0029CABC65|nr:hypothetical protein [Flavobacterium sp. N1736]
MKSIKKILRKIALVCLMGSIFMISIESIAQRHGGGGINRPGGGATRPAVQRPATQTRPGSNNSGIKKPANKVTRPATTTNSKAGNRNTNRNSATRNSNNNIGNRNTNISGNTVNRNNVNINVNNSVHVRNNRNTVVRPELDLTFALLMYTVVIAIALTILISFILTDLFIGDRFGIRGAFLRLLWPLQP